MSGDLGVFIAQLLRKPHQVVALAPSSRALSAEMAATLDPKGGPVIELGAGTAFFSAAIARAGAHPVAIDLNEDQLATARRCQQETGLRFPLVQADAQAVPLAEEPRVAAVTRRIQQGEHERRVGVRGDHPHRAGLGQRLHVVGQVHPHLHGVLDQLAQGGHVPHAVDDDVAVLEQGAHQHPLLDHRGIAHDRRGERAEVHSGQALVGAQWHERHEERRVGAQFGLVHRRQLVTGVQHQLLEGQEPGGHQRGATVHHVFAAACTAVTLRR